MLKDGSHFNLGADESDYIANKQKLFVDIYHVVSGKHISFKAFLTTFNDKYSSDWESETVYGRNDPLVTFKGTKRTMSIAWDIPAGSFEEAVENLEKCSMLAKFLYPAYDTKEKNYGGSSRISASPLLKLKFSNLIQDSSSPGDNQAKTSGLIGYIDEISINPELDVGVFIWDNGQIYPKLIKLSINFTVLHNHELGWDSEGKDRYGMELFPYGLGVPLEDFSTEDTTYYNQDNVVSDCVCDAAENDIFKGEWEQSIPGE
ncbi:hypothetical protein M0R19_04145 [Candidatus Pacearchaeota archaeon]|jgi:hypothetical protein|nr:hypothetical protein [Candidatus Pacearchaeota archaeon]